MFDDDDDDDELRLDDEEWRRFFALRLVESLDEDRSFGLGLLFVSTLSLAGEILILKDTYLNTIKY